MSNTLPKKAQVVIIGGGVIGCSVAYHLAKLGYTDIVLLERKKLTSGTTWHAAGLVGQMRSSLNLTQMVKYSGNLYETLEAETGMATGYRRTGSVSIATNKERLKEFKRNASLAKVHGVDVQILSPSELKEKINQFNLDDAVGGAWIPQDGKTDCTNVAMALAKGAKNNGVKIFEDLKVTGIHKEDGKVKGVQTELGDIQSSVVVNCGGMWAMGMETCVTLGMLTQEQAFTLKDAGLDYYNHNIDTSKEHYSNVVTTRHFQDRLDTLEAVKNADISVCSGGILGLGETETDRASMLQSLANLDVHPDSVPINLLVPIPGTPFENVKPPSESEFVRTIAVARILMPKSVVRLSAGRLEMGESMQALCFFAGANSIFYGEQLLTTDNPTVANDQLLFDRLGINI